MADGTQCPPRPDFYRAVRAMRLEPAIRATPSNQARTRLKLKVARPTVKSRIKWIRSKYEKIPRPGGISSLKCCGVQLNRCGVQIDYDSPPGDRHTANAQ